MRQEHLSDAQVEQYQGRSLSATELLNVDDHAAECAGCRARLRVATRPKHLSYEELLAGGPASAAHLDTCAMCRAEAEDLLAFRRELKKPIAFPVRRWLAAAAAVAVVALGIATQFRHKAAPETPAPVQTAVETLPELRRNPLLDKLQSARGTLLGTFEPNSRLLPVAPQGTAVLEDRPSFRWLAVRGARSYKVAVFDLDFKPVAASGQLEGTEWTPEKPLPRDGTYFWQVTAETAQGTLRAPQPPEPEARFQVLPETEAQRLSSVTGSPALQAIELANAGALDAALAKLQGLPDEGVKRQIQALRNPVR